MKIIKPQSLGVLHKPYSWSGRHYLSVATLGFFRLGSDNLRFLAESQQWPHVVPSLPAGMPLDEVMPRQHAEALLLGSAYAPQQKACTSVQVQLRIDDADGQALISKCLCVIGDRQWRRSLLSTRRISKPKPFLSMPLTYLRALGGPRSRVNPEGCGEQALTDMLSPEQHGAMPNISYPDNTATSSWRARVAAGFGPIPMGNRTRRDKFGTYQRRGQQNETPGFQQDIDWSVFNMAPADQWIGNGTVNGPLAGTTFKGGESYTLSNLHPQHAELRGKLPTLASRAFILQQSHSVDEAREVPLQMDTVWFLPDHALGIAIYHGQIEISDSDALDVATLMVGYEHQQQPKSLAHYQQVLSLRLDPATATAHVFNDSQLAAERSAADLQQRALMQQQAEAAVLARSQQRIDLLDAQYWAARGSNPPADHQTARATLPPLGIMTSQTATEGDFDLSDIMAKARALTAEVERLGKQAIASIAALPARNSDPAKLLETALEHASIAAYDLLPAELSGIDPQVSAMLAKMPTIDSAADAAAAKKIAADRKAVSKLPVLRRQGRRAAPKVVLPALPYPLDVAQALGAQIRLWIKAGVCLAGRDLAGADLAGIDLSGADLREVMLEGANLSDAILIGANLQGAVLVGTCLDRANFSRANLQKANLCASQGQHICFAGADMTRVQALDAQWPQADLRDADLRRLLGIRLAFPGAQLDRADASKATLFNLSADDSRWQGSTLTKTVLLGSSLQRSQFQGARLSKAAFNTTDLRHSNWDGARLDSVQAGARNRWSGASMLATQAIKCGFNGADMAQLDARQAAFLRCDFGRADLRTAQLDMALLSYCALFQSDLRMASATAAEFYQCLLRKTDFSQAMLTNTTFAQCDQTEAIAPAGKPQTTGSTA
jgi:uncharacterized protein YjbI with pentapeptide repeats